MRRITLVMYKIILNGPPTWDLNVQSLVKWTPTGDISLPGFICTIAKGTPNGDVFVQPHVEGTPTSDLYV